MAAVVEMNEIFEQKQHRTQRRLCMAMKYILPVWILHGHRVKIEA